MLLPPGAPCPCGSGTPYDGCCGPLHRRETEAATAEQLMRSRYSAFVVGDVNHIVRTWHPRTRPVEVLVDPAPWTGLEILDVAGGGSGDDEGVVEFVASWQGGAMRERSRFSRRRGRWVYVEAERAGDAQTGSASAGV